jgi:hypothetical protein
MPCSMGCLPFVYCWFLSWLALFPWEWRSYILLRYQWTSNKLHSITIQMTVILKQYSYTTSGKWEMIGHNAIITVYTKERNIELTFNRNGVVYQARPRVYPWTHARTQGTRNGCWARTRNYIIQGWWWPWTANCVINIDVVLPGQYKANLQMILSNINVLKHMAAAMIAWYTELLFISQSEMITYKQCSVVGRHPMLWRNMLSLFMRLKWARLQWR